MSFDLWFATPLKNLGVVSHKSLEEKDSLDVQSPEIRIHREKQKPNKLD